MKKMSLSLMAIAVIVFVFSSCEKDLYEDGLQNSARNITIKHISMSDLDKTTSLRINEKIKLVKKMNKGDSTTENRFEYDSSLEMYIDTENGRLIDNNGQLSYTFPMFRDSEEHLENIIFKPISTGEIETYVSKYNVKPEEFVDLTYQEIATLEPQLQKMSASGWYIVCVESQTQTGITPIDNGDLTGNFGYEPVWETTGTTCYFIDNSGSSPMDFPVITSNGTTGNNGGGTSSTGVSTSPTGISPEQLFMKDFVKNLNDEQEAWYVENPDAHESIQDYLEENVFSEQSKELVKNVIEMSLENDVELDFNVDEDNVQTIASLDDFESLIQTIKTEINDDDEGDSDIVGDQIFATKTINITPIHELVVEVVCNTSPFSLDNDGSTSFLGNIVIGNSWVQNSMSVTSSSYASMPQYAQITLVGYILVGVSLEGLEFGVKQRKKIKFLINKTTGEICCSTTENLN